MALPQAHDEMFVLFSPAAARGMLGSGVDWTGCLGRCVFLPLRTIYQVNLLRTESSTEAGKLWVFAELRIENLKVPIDRVPLLNEQHQRPRARHPGNDATQEKNSSSMQSGRGGGEKCGIGLSPLREERSALRAVLDLESGTLGVFVGVDGRMEKLEILAILFLLHLLWPVPSSIARPDLVPASHPCSRF